MQNAFRSFLVLSCLLASCGSGIEPEVASRPALISTETGRQASPNDDDHPTEDHDDARQFLINTILGVGPGDAPEVIECVVDLMADLSGFSYTELKEMYLTQSPELDPYLESESFSQDCGAGDLSHDSDEGPDHSDEGPDHSEDSAHTEDCAHTEDSTHADSADVADVPESAKELYAASALEIVKSFPVCGMECMDEFFDSYVDVFGINVIASGASDERLLHTAGVLAQYLDNDADGTPDDPAIAKYLADNNFVFPVWTVEVREEFWSTPCGIDKIGMAASIYHTGEHSTTDGLWSIGGIERSGIWDSNLEEVWHLVSVGFYNLYPNDFGDEDSALTAAMDAARGGYFPEEPANYPDGAWYTYTDAPYPVHVHEYFYWAVVTNFGALSPEILPDRCEHVKAEWRICSKADLQKIDAAVFELLNNRGYAIPKIIPDGIYLPVS